MNKTERVIEALSNIYAGTLICAYNDFCHEELSYEDEILYTDEIEIKCNAWTVSQILDMFDGFNRSCPYYVEGIYGAIEVWDVWEYIKEECTIKEFADFVIENGNDYGNAALREALDFVEVA